MSLRYSAKNKGTPSTYGVLEPATGPVALGYPLCLTAIMATAFLVNTIEKIVVGTPIAIFIPHEVEVLLNSPDTQHFLARCLTSYKVLLLTAPHITLLHCSNLKPAAPLPSITDKVLHNCLTLMTDGLPPNSS